LLHGHGRLGVTTTRNRVATEPIHPFPLLFGDSQLALRLGDLHARQRDERGTGRDLVAELGVSAHHQRFHTWGDQRDAVGVVDHLAGCLQHLTEPHRRQGLDAQAGRCLFRRGHAERRLGLVGMLTGSL
jgi:hypothetical protein